MFGLKINEYQYFSHTLPPGHWTCSFMCHLNSTESIQSCSRLCALNLSYTLPTLSYQVLIFTWVKWSIWGLSALPKDTTSKQCPNIERGETWYFSENPASSGIRNRTAGSDIGNVVVFVLFYYSIKPLITWNEMGFTSNFTLLKLWVAVARHNFNGWKIKLYI